MNKNARWGQKTALQVVLASGSLQAHTMFGGKTLAQVGAEYDLSDDDVKWGIGTNPNNGGEIRSLVLTVNGVMYQIPLSRGIALDKLVDPAYMLNCQFRTGLKSVKNKEGEPEKDAEGNIVLDKSAPYMSFGKPSGITIEKLENVFDEPVEGEEKAADVLVGGAAK